MLKVSNLSLSLGGQAVLRQASLSLSKGRTLAIVGESGCGKTSLLRCIAGLEKPSDGVIEINGQVVSGPDVHIKPGKRGVGLVFQDYALFPHINVEQNILFGLGRQTTEVQQKRLKEMLQLFQLEGLVGRYPHQLSGGQQQRVALARALAPDPALLLLDEPFSGYDVLLRDVVRRELRSLLDAAGTTTVIVTHDLKDALTMADEICIMRSGEVLQQARAEVLIQQPADEYVAMFMGAINRVELHAADKEWEAIFGLTHKSTDEPQKKRVAVFPADAFHQVTPGTEGSIQFVVERVMQDEKGFLVWCRTVKQPSVGISVHLEKMPEDHIHLTVDLRKVHVFSVKS